METKNLVLAVALSLIVLFGWGRFAEYMGWVAPPAPPVEQSQPAKPASVPAQAQEPALPVFTPSEGRDFIVNTPFYEATFYTGGGALRSFILKKYHVGILPDSPLINMVDKRTAQVAPLGLVINSQPSWSTGQWAMEGDAESLELQPGKTGDFILNGVVDGLRVKRHFNIDADTYLIKEKISLTNAGGQARSVRIAITQALASSISSGGQYDSMRIAWDNNGKLDDESKDKVLTSTGIMETGRIWWGGPMSTYFLAAALPGNPEGTVLKGRVQDNIWRVGLENEEIMLDAGQTIELSASYWTGPKDRAQMLAVSEQLAKSIDLGMFSIIAKGLLWLLGHIHQYAHNWGIAIIILTLIIKAAFWPLTAKSYASMEKMKQLQPLIGPLKEKYKDNKEQLNKEIMGLYKTYGVNPASGCVPILVQLPVFFGLYQALLTSIALRHASFITYLPGTHILWLADLSAKDPLYITPIIMGITMFIQQRMSPPPADPMQRKLMMFLPLIFTVLFLNFPSGLVLYWLGNNVLSIFQQWLMMRKLKKPASSAVPREGK